MPLQPSAPRALSLYFSAYVRLSYFRLLLFFASFYLLSLLLYIRFHIYISIVFITHSFLTRAIWFLFYLSRLVYCHFAPNVFSFLIIDIITDECLSFRPIIANSLFPLFPKSLYFAFSTHPNKSSKFHARKFQRFLTIRIQPIIPRGFPQKMIQKYGWA